MARPHPDPPDPDGFWPSCDDQQPGVSIRPLSHADLAALLAHLAPRPGPAPPEGPAGMPAAGGGGAGPGQRRPPRRLRPRRVPAPAGRRAGRLDPQPALAGRRGRRRRPGRLAGSPPGSLPTWRPWPGSRSRPGWAGCCGSAPLRHLGLAARRGRGAAHRPAAGPAGAARLGGPARPGHPRLRGQHRSPGHRPGRGAGDRHQAVPGAAAAGRRRDGLARPPPARLGPAQDPVGGRPGRRGPRHRRHSGRRHHGRAWRQRSLGRLHADGVTVVPARRVPDLLQALPPILGPERVAWLADRARLRFHAAA